MIHMKYKRIVPRLISCVHRHLFPTLSQLYSVSTLASSISLNYYLWSQKMRNSMFANYSQDVRIQLFNAIAMTTETKVQFVQMRHRGENRVPSSYLMREGCE